MIAANPFQRETEALMQPYLQAVERVLRSGWFILGKEVELFESELAEFLGAKHSVGCASGLDAIILALKALDIGPGDEVITTPLSAVATALAITHVGARPIFVDVLPESLCLDPAKVQAAITPKARAVIPVHLYGFPAQVSILQDICDQAGIAMIEDCAQAIGTREKGKTAGNIGKIGCFSFYPTKNLGAFGDAGAVSTNDPKLEKKIRMLRNYGQKARYEHELLGYNSRLDEIQAALLRIKLKHLTDWNQRRIQIAKLYDAGLAETGVWHLPPAPQGSKCVYHLYPVQISDRDKALSLMKEQGIEGLVHYPTLIPEQKCYEPLGSTSVSTLYPVAFKASRSVLSLPINPFVDDFEVNKIIKTVLQHIQA